MGTRSQIRTLADILPTWAALTPGKTALLELDPKGSLRPTSYAELRRQADAFAAAVHRIGVRHGDRVAILMPNSRSWAAAYFGVFRLGATAVPLEHALLAERSEQVQFALHHAEARCVVCDAADRARVEEIAGPGCAVLTAQQVDLNAAAPDLPPQPEVKPGDLAQVLYTSGTTGPRKGVMLSHGNVIFDVEACCRRFCIRSSDRMPAILPFHHAYPLTATIVLPFYGGATIAVGDARDRRTRDLMRLCRPTALVGVPRLFESLLQGIRNAADRRGRLDRLEQGMALSRAVKRLTGLNAGKLVFRRVHMEMFGGMQIRFCVTGGARISPETLRGFFLLGIPVVQGWGMSELSPVAAAQPFSPSHFYLTRHYERKAGSIGTSLDGTSIELVQSPSEELSFDLADRGEMAARGPHVMLGYLKDPECTAHQMLGGALRSGDIARRDKDGNFYIIGRVKHVIVLSSGKKVFPEDDLDEDLSRCRTILEFAVRPVTGADGAEKIGIIVRPNVEELWRLGTSTMGEVCRAVKADVDRTLEGKPAYLRHYELCLTRWTGEDFAELAASSLGKPCPLLNAFDPDRSYARLRADETPAPWMQ